MNQFEQRDETGVHPVGPLDPSVYRCLSGPAANSYVHQLQTTQSLIYQTYHFPTNRHSLTQPTVTLANNPSYAHPSAGAHAHPYRYVATQPAIHTPQLVWSEYSPSNLSFRVLGQPPPHSGSNFPMSPTRPSASHWTLVSDLARADDMP